MHLPLLLRSSLFLTGALAPWLALADETTTTTTTPSEAVTPPSDVVDLDAESFATFTTQNPISLVEFFAPWCGHCKSLAPEYEVAATTLKEKGIKLAKIDCTEHGDFCQTQGVLGFPTLHVYKNGSRSEYKGPRKADGITSYMIKQSLPAVTPVTAENHDEFKVADKIVIIAYVSKTEDAPVPAFSAVAEKHRDDYLFGLTTDEAAIKAAGITTPAIVLYKKFDEGRDDLPANEVKEATVDSIASFVKANSMPLFDEVSGENYQAYADSGKPLAYLFVDPADKEAREAIVKELTPVSKKHKGKVNFVWIDAVKFVEHGKNLGLKEGQWPAFIIQQIETQLKFPLDQTKATSFANVEEHVDAYVAGKLHPVLKSEAIPQNQSEKYLKVVGTEFEKHVLNDEKDVFIQFSAPWCGHCKRLLPTWETLAETYKESEKLLIAKMDATENDIPPSAPFQVTGFPTIKFKPAGTRDFIDYDGDRTLEDLIAFVSKHAKHTHEAKIPPPQPAEEVESLGAEEETESAETPTDTTTTETPAETPVTSEAPSDVHDEL